MRLPGLASSIWASASNICWRLWDFLGGMAFRIK
jgi:hypothetical protein